MVSTVVMLDVVVNWLVTLVTTLSVLSIETVEMLDPSEYLPAGQSIQTRLVAFVHATISSCPGKHGRWQSTHGSVAPPTVEYMPG
jgi:hypothetical protein